MSELTFGTLFAFLASWCLVYIVQTKEKDGLEYAFLLVSSFLAIIFLVMGILTYKLKPAGRVMHLTAYAIVFLLAVISILTNFCSPEPIVFIVIMTISSCLFYYFNRPKVREQFKPIVMSRKDMV